MYYYKFRVYYDEVEDFVRDIEILSNDNFENFHKILVSSIGLDGQELASFYVCDSKWNKQKEISLMDMGDDSEKEEPEYEEDDEFSLRSKLPISVMKDSLLKDFIADPHQHLMYEYDFLNPKVFYIELLKVLKEEEEEVKELSNFKDSSILSFISKKFVKDSEENDSDNTDDAANKADVTEEKTVEAVESNDKQNDK